jgi:DNA processing protein
VLALSFYAVAMSDRMRHRLARLARAQNVNAEQLRALAASDPALELIERRDPAALARLGLPASARAALLAPDLALIAADEAWLDSAGVMLLPATSPDYPPLLARLPDAPAVLYVRGDVSVLAEPQIAMVGSRNPTAGGRDTARTFAGQFARAGLGVTSGLALGIDAASHEGALAAGGVTTAVLGCGLDSIYPAENRALAERIVKSGAVISEFPPGTAPLRAHFPQRNRIIAGLAAGTVVVEAACRSGSLITARLAGTAGREVFAVPGSIHNEMARGCHELIRQGAKLIERADDVLCELKISLADQLLGGAPGATDGASRSTPVLDKAYKILLDALAFEPASVDSLIERTGLNSESIASMLLILELDGHVAPHPGGRYSRMAGP